MRWIFQERASELAKANYEVGTTSKSEYLAAQVDYNGKTKRRWWPKQQVIQNAAT
jgi:outer membrane protein